MMTEGRNPTVAEEPAAERVMRSLDYRLYPHARVLTPEEVSCVLRALADHTSIMAALAYRPDPTSPWPFATSLGRWFHDTADQLLTLEEKA